MNKIILLTLAAALFAGTAQAGGKFGSPRNHGNWKQYQVEEEFRRAREVGGYNDPITALSNILSGRATSKDITTGTNNIYDLPQFGTVRFKGRWD